MPRVKLPPTPACSLDIQAKELDKSSGIEGIFTLPSPTMASACLRNTTSKAQYILPATAKPSFELPPPPTRPRKIIQMKPASRQTEQSQPSQADVKRNNSRKGTSGTLLTAVNAGGKKKPPSSTSAAGKKMARKTAHSVIERRRRSKMNEEFAELKSMIPACKDQEMHKLAILSASIEYLRYLERCVADLQAANTSIVQPPPPPPFNNISNYSDEDEEGQEDQEMEDTPTKTSFESHPEYSPHSLAASPALSGFHISSSYASSTATLPSPASGPSGSYHSYSHSASTSPTILPDNAQDHEATAALLMLNRDRRDSKVSTSGRGISVKDLLSPA